MEKKIVSFLACLLIGIGLAIAQTPRKVTGTVLFEEDNQPIVGASVLIKGTNQGVVTNLDGRFTLTNVPSTAKTLRITYVGMQTIEVNIKSGEMKIMMQPDAEILDEVVITGMTKMDRRLFTGASTKLSSTDVKLDGLADISRSLEGRAAGVSVQNVSGTFGTAPKIRVRGATSIYGSSKPLWVVDGVIMEDVTEVSADELSSGDAVTLISSAIAGLNANDIESFEILKDGSATSIYGARAMAGVIVVTTKKGQAGKSHISYTGEFTMRLIPSYGDFNIMNSQEQMGVYKEMKDKGWLNFSDTYRASQSGVYGKMYQLLNTYDPTTGRFALENTDSAINAYLQAAEFRNTDWFDALFSTSVMHNHSVSVSAGTDKAHFYASLSAMVDPGWYKDSKVNRYTANLNTTYNISKQLSLNLISSASYRKQQAPGTLSQSVDPVYGEVKRDFDINPYSYSLNTSRALDARTMYTRNYADFNILHELENNYMNLDVADMKFQGELRWKPLKGLEFAALGAVKYSSTSQEHQITDDSNQARAYRAMPDATVRDRNPFLYTDPDDPYALPITVLPQGGIYQKTTYKMLGYDFRATGSWNHVFAEDHIVNLFAGMESNSTDRNKNYFNGWGMQYSQGEIPFYTYQFFKKSIEEGTDYYSLSNTRSRSAAFFANATYSYKGRYTVNGTYRYEGTNRLGKSRSARWLPTWNISGAWNMHEEEFFESLKPALAHFSLKASYSLTGDPGPSTVTNSTMVLKSYKPYRPFASIQESGLNIIDLANDELTYEKKHELNIGADMGFLDNRINFAIDWYKRSNFDLIGVIQTPGVGGQIRKLANVATMKSHGIEFTLSTKNINTKNFGWNTDFIFSQAKNKVTDLESDAEVIDVVSGTGFALKGYPVRGLFSYQFKGLNEIGLPTFIDQDGNLTSDGNDIDFQSQTLDNLKYEGPTDPTITGSFGNIFRYKGFKLNLFITYSFGNVIRLDPIFSNEYSDLTAMPKEFKNRWTLAGEENITNVPTILTKRQSDTDRYLKTLYNAYNYSTERIAKGDFIRMKEISLSYDFPKSWLKKIQINDLSLKLQATNLFLFYSDDKLNGQDPEFFRSGGVAAPVPKQFTLTLRLGI
ncbi:SusC/RagA family TonB-linked outer membrane protein [uncultured Bacteroides sp.]|uniref:SusC/RagA family TonB-linked outer membrane protein n=1 Tax=uncultured Bacteroides sp. TaxID=162156 RepID=UPI00263153BC|nr:SusC/RagA family TonB-linked outer membrane protein [uncultured Bacteroides sp.]